MNQHQVLLAYFGDAKTAPEYAVFSGYARYISDHYPPGRKVK
jgi:hypothetical protein